jgi:hypothetical protein
VRLPREFVPQIGINSYDQHHVRMVIVVVTLPDILPCVLRGGVGPVGAISSAIGSRDVFVAQ